MNVIVQILVLRLTSVSNTLQIGGKLEFWYPTQSRVKQLSKELDHISLLVLQKLGGANEIVPELSITLDTVTKLAGFPNRQIPQWVWLGSQFRLHASTDENVAVTAGTALFYLEKVKEKTSLHDTDVQDLNWILETAVQKLSNLLNPENLRSCLSYEELVRIESQLNTYDILGNWDDSEIRGRVKKQLSQIGAMSNDGYLRTLSSKVEGLFNVANGTSETRNVARQALLYLADEHDVVCDSNGFLGLLDDVYVIDWAFCVVENLTRCLPLLKEMISRWPLIAELALFPVMPFRLDRYSQYVIGASLRLVPESNTATILVLRENTGYPILSAFFHAIECMKSSAEANELNPKNWIEGSPITIADGSTKFKAIFLNEITVSNKIRYKIGVRASGSITVPASVLPYMSVCNENHRLLSSGNDISKWVLDRHLDPLNALIGANRPNVQNRHCVLLLAPRKKLDEFIKCINPLGSSVQSLVGISYVATSGEIQQFPGSITDVPYIYACSNADVASELIMEPPSHVKGWKIVIDGARAASDLVSTILASGELEFPPLHVFANLSERENTQELMKHPCETWFLEDHDVEAPPLMPLKIDSSSNSLQSSLIRQGNHWTTSQSFHISNNDFLEQLAEWMSCRRDVKEQEDGLDFLDMAVSAFIQRISECPISCQAINDKIDRMAADISSQASVLKNYNESARTIGQIFSQFAGGGVLTTQREQNLCNLMETLPTDGHTAILCRSSRIAELCANSAMSTRLGDPIWLNFEQLRQDAPFDRIIVSGWLDRFSARELTHGSYSTHIDFLLYPFERTWLERTVNADRRWERALEALSSKHLLSLTSSLSNQSGTKLWKPQIEAKIEDISNTSNSQLPIGDADIPEHEFIEARAIDAIGKNISASKVAQESASAQLVLFEEIGSHAFFPPTGKVIILSDAANLDKSQKLSDNDVEKVLFTGVADLQPGDVLALPLETAQDLIDAKADSFIENAFETRALASLWKKAIGKYIESSGDSYLRFSQLMAAAGQPRHHQTIRLWINKSNTTAPQNYRETIPLIAELTGDQELISGLNEVLQAIDSVYRAKTSAAQAIVAEVFAGEIDLNAPEIAFVVSGSKVRYAIRTIKRIGGIHKVPTELIGELRQLGSSSQMANVTPASTI